MVMLGISEPFDIDAADTTEQRIEKRHEKTYTDDTYSFGSDVFFLCDPVLTGNGKEIEFKSFENIIRWS